MGHPCRRRRLLHPAVVGPSPSSASVAGFRSPSSASGTSGPSPSSASGASGPSPSAALGAGDPCPSFASGAGLPSADPMRLPFHRHPHKRTASPHKSAPPTAAGLCVGGRASPATPAPPPPRPPAAARVGAAWLAAGAGGGRMRGAAAWRRGMGQRQRGMGLLAAAGDGLPAAAGLPAASCSGPSGRGGGRGPARPRVGRCRDTTRSPASQAQHAERRGRRRGIVWRSAMEEWDCGGRKKGRSSYN
ncbi:hypothetical protein SETIT_9G061900v2 [Setaria italica]|uniref:Uncharacterized protein n=1 Tax=Setaria italica TaxID=4555 RepID=A0A368SDU0_SETIT|nr:hypothetical protein SETIT_9G061900v2 [Setaria italica]